MKMLRKTVSAMTIMLLALLCVMSASAAPVVWTLDGVTRSDGGTVSGSFTYDATTNTYSAVSITSTGGSSAVPGETYGDPDFSSAGVVVFYRSPQPADLTGENGIGFQFLPDLTNSGGTVTLAVTSTEYVCSQPDCSPPLTAEVFLTGQVTAGGPSTTPATPVPTISAYGLALTMLGLLFVAARRLRTSTKRGKTKRA